MSDELPMDVIENGKKLTLLKYIAKGTFGIVYSGTYNGKLIAVKKQLNTVNVDLEYSHLILCKSEYVVKTFTSIYSNSYRYIVMEKADMNLKEYVEKFKETVKKPTVFAYIAWQLISGLHELEKLDIIHRDYKPLNIVVVDKTFKICDFGLATFAARKPNSKTGTRIIIAPEVVLKHEYDFKADIWSLGVTLFYMCTGKYPFTGCDKSRSHLTSIAEQLDLGGLKEEILRILAIRNIFIEKPGTEPLIFKDYTVFFRQQQLILACLKCDPKSRSTAADLLQHGIFTLGPKANIDHVPSANGAHVSKEDA